VQIKFIVDIAGRCTLLAEWLIGDQLAMAIQALTSSLSHSSLTARRKWGRGEWEREEGDPRDSTNYRKREVELRMAKGRRRHTSVSWRYMRRQEAKQGKEKNRSDLKSLPT
jgi:hypothetical protein